MPYTQTTLDDFVAQIGVLMDDEQHVYWTVPEIQLATWEGLRVFGAYTNYWRARGTFTISPNPANPFNDLSVKLPTLRTRTWTLGMMVTDIQAMLLEPMSGIPGTGMSGQVTVSSILNAIQVARNRFVLDARLPLSYVTQLVAPPPPDGMVVYTDEAVYVHRVSWQDKPSGVWTNLFEDDTYSYDKGQPLWTIEPGAPVAYSETDNAPLKLQILPPPINEGMLDALDVDSKFMDLTDPAALFGVPDEWIHAIKYSALSYLLAGEGQIKDMVRADYAEKRYQQALAFCEIARSVMRLMVNNIPLGLDSMYNLDASQPYWRNQTGPPNSAGALYDMVAISPGNPDQLYSVSADVVQTAPLPELGSPDPDHQLDKYIQLGREDLDDLTGYVTHVLTFKCGGQEFKGTFSAYEDFMEAVDRRQSIVRAEIKYLSPLMGQPSKEWEQRPDRKKLNA